MDASSSKNPACVGGSSDAVDLNLATTIAMLQEVPKVNTQFMSPRHGGGGATGGGNKNPAGSR